jgi:hypothetical protein
MDIARGKRRADIHGVFPDSEARPGLGFDRRDLPPFVDDWIWPKYDFC